MASSSTTNIPETSSSSKDDFLNEILTCGICLSRMSSPCCLPCAHSFCRSCLLDYARNHTMHISMPINAILCPYCKHQVSFRSFEHFESMLIVNPILKQLCEVLDAPKSQSESSTTGSTSGTSRARCHSCCLLKMLKVCKHCYFMLCETCRRTHLLDVHRESQIQLDILESRLRLINNKRLEMDKITREYDRMREHIRVYAEQCLHEIEQQRDQALRILDERQHSNDESFWASNGFDNGEKLDFFISLAETGQKKLSAKNITDKDLMELADNLQTIPDVDEKTIQSIHYTSLILKFDQTFPMKRFIHVYDEDEDKSPMTSDEYDKLSTDQSTTDCLNS